MERSGSFGRTVLKKISSRLTVGGHLVLSTGNIQEDTKLSRND